MPSNTPGLWSMARKPDLRYKHRLKSRMSANTSIYSYCIVFVENLDETGALRTQAYAALDESSSPNGCDFELTNFGLLRPRHSSKGTFEALGAILRRVRRPFPARKLPVVPVQ